VDVPHFPHPVPHDWSPEAHRTARRTDHAAASATQAIAITVCQSIVGMNQGCGRKMLIIES